MTGNITPETDALVPQFLNGGEVPDIFAHCRKLERERDEAREDLEFRRELYKVQEEYLEAARRDLGEAQIECLEQARLLGMSSEREAKLIYERDEAIKLHKKSLFEREAAERETDAMLERAQKVERERDETRDAIRALAEHGESEIQRITKERDEAREAIPAGEWVAHEDYKKVHEAASRLLVAINKELPIGCFTLVSSEYYRLQNAIYGREGTK